MCTERDDQEVARETVQVCARRQAGGIAGANLFCRTAARRPKGTPEAARSHSRRGSWCCRRVQLRHSGVPARWTTTRLVCRVDEAHQPLSDVCCDSTCPRRGAEGLSDVEGDDSIPTRRTASAGSCEATRQGPDRRDGNEAPAMSTGTDVRHRVNDCATLNTPFRACRLVRVRRAGAGQRDRNETDA
jgi:hypothetical protein